MLRAPAPARLRFSAILTLCSLGLMNLRESSTYPAQKRNDISAHIPTSERLNDSRVGAIVEEPNDVAVKRVEVKPIDLNALSGC